VGIPVINNPIKEPDMDLKDLKPVKNTIDVTLEHPATGDVLLNEDGTPMVISLFAPYSKEYKELMYKRADERIKKASSEGKEEFSAKLVDEATTSILAESTSSWSITYDKKQPRLTPAKALEVYTELFWIRPQLEKAINDDEVFT
jgi:hypothetical protein